MSTDPPAPVTQQPGLSAFAREQAPTLLRFAYLLTGDRQLAEDLLQDVFLAMHRRFGDGPLPLGNPVGYVRRALANQNISRARRASSSEVVVDLFEDRPAAAGGSDLGERDVLWRALLQLPVRQRTVLVLRYYADATDDDIAASLDCRRGTVRSLASRGLAALRGDPSLDLDTQGGAR